MYIHAYVRTYLRIRTYVRIYVLTYVCFYARKIQGAMPKYRASARVFRELDAWSRSPVAGKGALLLLRSGYVRFCPPKYPEQIEKKDFYCYYLLSYFIYKCIYIYIMYIHVCVVSFLWPTRRGIVKTKNSHIDI